MRKLGEGGMGVVYEAFDRERAMPVALKTLRNLDATSLYRFKREFRALSDVSHPNIVALYELVSEENEWFFTMELLEGVDFLTYVRADGFAERAQHAAPDRRSTSPVTEDTRTMTSEVVDASAEDANQPTPNDLAYHQLVNDRRLRRGLIQLAHALEALHRAGMVHRDLKPSNVRVTPTGRIVLMDFGIVADANTRGDDSSEPRAIGTPSYMAPEQAANEPANAAADWYSFGVVLYLALTARLPFSGPRDAVLYAKQTLVPVAPRQLTARIATDLDELCMDLLQRDPRARPTGEQVLARLGAEADATDTSTTGASSVFVGRTAELHALQQAYDRVADVRDTTACFVVGQSGMGKSTLIRRFVHELEARRGARDMPVIVRGRCNERESLPYKAFDSVVDDLTQFLLGLDTERARSLLPGDVDLLSRLFPVLRRVPGVQTSRPHGGMDPQILRQRAFGVLRELLRRIGEWRPVVLGIDDLQWVDADSLDLLAEILREPPPLLLVVSIRAESLEGAAPSTLTRVMDEISDRVDSRTILLGPLSQPEQESLVERLMGAGAPINREFWRESAGSPFFLGELVRYAQELGGELDASQPPRLEDVLLDRIGRLPAPARALLEAVAVAGEPTPLGALALAVDLDTAERERASAVLRVGSLVRIARHGTEPWLAPYHDRVRETLTERLPPERQRDLHQRLALALERTEGTTVDVLARHWLAAGDRHQATTYLVSAAEAATAKLAFGRAADLYQAALSLGDHPPQQAQALRVAMAAALARAGRYFDAGVAYGEAAEADETDRGELIRLAADNYLRAGQVERGLGAMREVMGQLGIRYAPTHRRALLSLGLQRARTFLRGLRYTVRSEDEIPARDLGRLDTLYAASTTLGMIDHVRGADLQTRHLLQALRFGEERRVCRALAIEAVYRAAAGGRNARRAQELSREVELMARRLGDPYLISIALLAVGASAFFGARPRAAVAAFEKAEHLLSSECVGADWERVTARFFICNAQIQLGDLDAVGRAAIRFTEEAERKNDVYTRNLFKTQPTTWYHLLRDEPDAAQQAADEALAGWPDNAYYIAHHLVGVSGGIIALYRGDHDGAAARFAEVAVGLRRTQLIRLPWVAAELHHYAARAAFARGDAGRVRRSIRFFTRVKLPAGLGVAAGYRGFLALRSGDRDRGMALLHEGQRRLEDEDFNAIGNAYRFRLGELTEGSEGARLREGALSWYRDRGAVQPDKIIDLFAPAVPLRLALPQAAV
ncbi:MAG TPA: protein kinase [Kofleriaceae bacterium]|nr:protein kinase [Kofleriaceae bacterium]